MSAFVVNDVSNQTAAQAIKVGKTKVKSTITPFQKMMAAEESKVSAAQTQNKTSEVKSSDVDSGLSTSLKDIFKRASEKYDISYDFIVAVAKAESDFSTTCVSSAGAKGIMQLMPDECKEFGVDNPFDAEENIMAATKLLKAHLNKFDGDFTLAAAAYNAGSGAVKKYNGVPPYTETQNYVKKIKKFMNQGVDAPDKQVKTGSSSFDTGAAATEADLNDVIVAVGSGDSAVKMTYGAYLKYLELGTTGVG